METYVRPFNSYSNPSPESSGEGLNQQPIVDPTHPNFHKQFASGNNRNSRNIALLTLQKLTSLALASLPFNYRSCEEYNKLIVFGMCEVLESDGSEEKGEFFVKLVRTMNAITLKISQADADLIERCLFIDLMDKVRYLNSKKAFVGLDLRGFDLNHLDVNNLDVRNLALDLSYSDFTGATLDYADLTKSVLTKAIFLNADMNHAILVGTTMVDTDLTRANLTGAEFTGADMNGAVLSGATLTEIKITGIKNAPLELQMNDVPEIKKADSQTFAADNQKIQIKHKRDHHCTIF